MRLLREICIWVILIILLVMSNNSFAQTIYYNDEFRVNSYTQGNQVNPRLLKLTEESFVVCWQSYGQYGSYYSIYAQIFSNSGEKIGGEFRVNAHYRNSAPPSLLKLTEEKFIVCWHSYDGYSSVVYAQIFNNSGEKIGSQFRVNDSTQGGKENPRLLKLTEESFVVCWESFDQDGSSWGIYAQIFNNSGEKIGAEFRINTYTQEKQKYAYLLKLTEERFIVCWDSWPNQDGSVTGIYAQIFNNSGEKIGSEFRINSYTQNIQSNARLLKLTEESFLACWQSNGQDGSSVGIYAQIFNNNGEKIGEEFRVNNFMQNESWSVNLLKLTEYSFLISWNTWYQDGSRYDVYGQMFTNNGEKQGEEFRINTYTQSMTWWESSCILRLTQECFAVVWNGEGQDGNSYGVYSQIFTNNGKKVGKEFRINTYTNGINTASLNQSVASLLKLTEESFVVCWKSYGQDGSGNGVYGKIYLSKPVNHVFDNFFILEPEHDEYLNTVNPKFKWSFPSNQHINFQWEISYDLYLAENDTFDEPLIITGINDTTYQIDSLEPGKTYYWKVLAKNYYGDSLWSSNVNGFYIDPSATDIEEENLEMPKEYSIAQNYPNPFNPTTTIKYSIPEAGFVTIKVYDILGREIAVLVNEYKQSGTYEIKFDGSNLSSGVYLYRITSGSFSATRKMILCK